MEDKWLFYNGLNKNFLNTTRFRWSSFDCTCLENCQNKATAPQKDILSGTIPHLEFTIEIQSNSLMYNPNKEIRDKVFPVKIGKFSVIYYTFD